MKICNRMIALMASAAMPCMSSAWAQTAPSSEPAATTAAASPADQSTVPASDADSTATGDIVVTAQRRSERLSNVPIAITAITPERMEVAGITSTLDLAVVTPGLSFPTSAAFAQPVIRGVGSALTGPGADPAVALYVDGVYQPNQLANVFDFTSIEQVEVLKGPQGTLFGRNATGGAITVRTLNPSFAADARISATYSRFNQAKVSAYLSGPLVGDVIAANVALYYRREDSFTYNVATGHKLGDLEQYAVRPKLLFQPSSTLKFILSGTLSRTRDPRLEGFAPRDGNNTQDILHPTVPRATKPYDISFTEDPDVVVRNKSVSLRGELDISAGTLSTITAYGNIHALLKVDGDSSAFTVSSLTYKDKQETFSQEVNFASRKFGDLSVIAGLFYYDDNASRDLLTERTYGGTFIRRTVAGVRTKAYAAYTEATVDVGSKLHLTGGLRYSHENKKATGVQIGTPPGTLDASADFGGFTPRIAARYELTDRSNVYATFSRGFKSGSFNAIALQATPVKQEEVSAYEIGYKMAAPTIRFNASAFYYDYQNIQVQSSITTSVLVLQNAAAARIYGADADLWLRLTDDWTLEGGAAYTHGRYTKFPGALIVVRGPNGINQQTTGDVSGNPVIRTPTFTANGTLSWNHQVELGKLSASATGSYNSGYYWQADKRIREPAYFLLNAQVGLGFHDDGYRVSLWGRNLFDKRYAVYQAQSSIGDNIIYDLPRTYGVTLSASF